MSKGSLSASHITNYGRNLLMVILMYSNPIDAEVVDRIIKAGNDVNLVDGKL